MAASSRSTVRSLDMPILDRVFGMEGGYVLDFSNRTFAAFFREELDVDIDDPCWEVEGGSKAKRLRYYLRQADRRTALDALNALWEYREVSSATADYPELDDSVRTAYFSIIERLGGRSPEPVVRAASHSRPRIDPSTASALAARLIEVSSMDPQPRGYAFEQFLKDVFDAYGLRARAPFRLKGEQIDGSFVLDNQTYLLEAKWRNEMVNAETLRAFNAKVEDKASRSRGLIISQSGFTPEGLHAFGRGHSRMQVVRLAGLFACTTAHRRTGRGSAMNRLIATILTGMVSMGLNLEANAQVLKITNNAGGVACYDSQDLLEAHSAIGFYNFKKVELLIARDKCFIMQKHWKPLVSQELVQ